MRPPSRAAVVCLVSVLLSVWPAPAAGRLLLRHRSAAAGGKAAGEASAAGAGTSGTGARVGDAIRRDGDGEVPPGDVSAVDEFANNIHRAGAGQAAKIGKQFGSVVAEKLQEAAVEAEEAVKDPVGAIGGAVDSVAQAVDDGLMPTAPPEEAEDQTPGVPAVPGLPAAWRYFAATTLPPFIPMNGVYCRGGACQYRSQPAYPPTLPPVLGQAFAWPCRGLACPRPPEDPVAAAFVTNCSHIFLVAQGDAKARTDLPEGMQLARTIGDARNDFVAACHKLLPLETKACGDFGQVFVAALSSDLKEPTVGGERAVCARLNVFISDMRKAAISLGFIPSKADCSKAPTTAQPTAAPPPPPAPSPATAGGPALLSARGKTRLERWRQWWTTRHRKTGTFASLGQRLGSQDAAAAAPPEEEYGVVPQAMTHYVLAPGSPDGVVPPIEVQGDLFESCTKQVKEITLGHLRTAAITVQMTRDWCGFQSVKPPAGDPNGAPAHPEWSFYTCTAMAELMAFSLRDRLRSQAGVGALEVCKDVFRALGVIKRVDEVVRDAWSLAGRAPLVGNVAPPGPDDSRWAMAAKASAAAAEADVERLEAQKAAIKAVDDAKDLVDAALGPGALPAAP